MVRAPRARNIFPALLSIFRPLSPDILPPMWEGKLFSYILSSPSRVGKHGDDGASPPPQGIRGCPPGVQARGPCVQGCSVGASAAPYSADFDPPGRTAPAGRGGRQPRALCGLPTGGRAVSDHRRWGGGETATRAAPLVLLVTLRLAGYELWGSPRRGASLHRGGGARARRRHEHRKEAGSIRGGAGARPTAQLWSALGNFCPPPAGPIFLEFWGFAFPSHPGLHSRERRVGENGVPRRGLLTPTRVTGPPIRPSSPRPLPVRGLLGNCDLNGC